MEEWELDSPLSTWTLKHVHNSSSKPPTERKNNDICDNYYPEFYKTTNQKGKPIRNKDKKPGYTLEVYHKRTHWNVSV